MSYICPLRRKKSLEPYGLKMCIALWSLPLLNLCGSRKKGRGEKSAGKIIPLSFSLPPNPLPLSKPATQGNPCLPLVNYSTVKLFYCRVGKHPGPGGGGIPLYKPYRCVPPNQGGFLGHFGLESHGIGYGFRGNYKVYERIYLFNSKWVQKKEKYANSQWIWRIHLFAL